MIWPYGRPITIFRSLAHQSSTINKKVRTVRRKIVLFVDSGMLGTIAATFMACNNNYSSRAPTIVLRNFNPQAGFHCAIYSINHAFHACEQSGRHKLVVCLDSDLYSCPLRKGN